MMLQVGQGQSAELKVNTSWLLHCEPCVCFRWLRSLLSSLPWHHPVPHHPPKAKPIGVASYLISDLRDDEKTPSEQPCTPSSLVTEKAWSQQILALLSASKSQFHLTGGTAGYCGSTACAPQRRFTSLLPTATSFSSPCPCCFPLLEHVHNLAPFSRMHLHGVRWQIQVTQSSAQWKQSGAQS